MAAARRGEEPASLHQSVGFLSIAAGALLLATHFYSFTRPTPLLPSPALGVLLLLVSSLLAYAGVRKSLQSASLFVSLCLSLSALWGGYGAIQFLAGEGLLRGAADLRDAAVPGLVAFSLGLLLIALVGLLQREVPLALMALAASLACAHETATHYHAAFGSAAVACSYLLVCLAGGYLGVGRALFFFSKGTLALPGTDLAQRKQRPGQGGALSWPGTNDLTAVGLILNMLSASVFACRLLGATGALFVGQVPWLWAAALYQLGVCAFSYRCLDALTATAFGFVSLLAFGGGYSLLALLWLPEEPVLPAPFSVVLAALLALLALFRAIDSLADGLYLLSYVAYCVALACQPRGFFAGGPQGVAVAIFVASALLALLHLYQGAAGVRLPVGARGLRPLLSRLGACQLWEGKGLHAPYLGYSRYADAEVLGYACSVLAAFAIAMVAEPKALLATVVLPWVVVGGGILKLLCGSVAFSRGKTLESSTFILYGFVWIILGLARFGGLYSTARGFQAAVGSVALLLCNAFMVLGSLFLSASWFAYSLTFELVLIGFLLDAVGAVPAGYDVAAPVLFGLASFYCFLSALVSSTFQSPQLPAGRPIVRLGGSGGGSARCPHLPARKASSVKQVAEIMKKGGACGIPTDTVYVLVAACSRPDAVAKAHNTKRHAQDRPMSLWISSLKQLEPARHLFSALLWDFMAAAWPSPISLVVPRGEWVDCLGMQDSARYVGTPQSVAIRIPDCSVTTHLIDLVGPITVTSANPTGEADTTHHNQVYAKLGDQVDAVLCDGPSPENIASTVVDCTKLEKGDVGFFRVGIVPKSQVLQILEQVRKKHQPTSSAEAEEGKEEEHGVASALSSGTCIQGSAQMSCTNGVFSAEEPSMPP